VTLTIGSCFSGIGGLELGLEAALGARVVWQVEQDDYCRRVLAKHWPDADRSVTDVREAGANLVKPDIICGGFPCQDISVAGKREGIHGKRSGLWFEFRRILSELRPRVAVLENVPAVTRYSGVITGGLVEIGYDCEWQILSANDMGAPHLRKRWFLVAYLPDSDGGSVLFKPGRKAREGGEDTLLSLRDGEEEHVANANGEGQLQQGIPVGEVRRRVGDGGGQVVHPASRRLQEQRWTRTDAQKFSSLERPGWWATEPDVGRMAHGVPSRMDRLRALGNAVVPQCAYEVGCRVREVLS
jgi:DNA (cytosine-5)-methyltransferase 1